MNSHKYTEVCALLIKNVLKLALLDSKGKITLSFQIYFIKTSQKECNVEYLLAVYQSIFISFGVFSVFTNLEEIFENHCFRGLGIWLSQ